jgi:O-antigen ligase
MFLWNLSLLVEIEPAIASMSWGRMLLAGRGEQELWSLMLYYKLLGNFNKQANILVVSLILTAYLYVRGIFTFRMWLFCSIPIAMMTVIMFSRGAFLTLAVVSLGLFATAVWRPDRRRKDRRHSEQLIAAIGIGGVVAASFAAPEWRDYWRNISTVEQREEMAVSAFTGTSTFTRSGDLTQAKEVKPQGFCVAKEPDRSALFFLFGYGLGNYGPTICRAPEAESHNAFVDAWIQGGVAGVFGFLGLFVVGAVAGARRLLASRMSDTEALFGLAVLGAITLLCLREYALVYLWIQSSGGFVLGVGLALCSFRARL